MISDKDLAAIIKNRLEFYAKHGLKWFVTMWTSGTKFQTFKDAEEHAKNLGDPGSNVILTAAVWNEKDGLQIKLLEEAPLLLAQDPTDEGPPDQPEDRHYTLVRDAKHPALFTDKQNHTVFVSQLTQTEEEDQEPYEQRHTQGEPRRIYLPALRMGNGVVLSNYETATQTNTILWTLPKEPSKGGYEIVIRIY
jgi:hypothetical protein